MNPATYTSNPSNAIAGTAIPRKAEIPDRVENLGLRVSDLHETISKLESKLSEACRPMPSPSPKEIEPMVSGSPIGCRLEDLDRSIMGANLRLMELCGRVEL